MSELNYRFDFNNLAVNLDEWLTGGDVGFVVDPVFVDDEPSLYKITTDNDSGDDAYLHGNEKFGLVFSINEEGGATVTFEARIRLLSATNVESWFGLINPLITTPVASPPNSTGFFQTGGNWQAVNENGAAESTDTGVAPDTSWHKFTIVWDASDILYYIDDVLKATHSTPANFPLAPIFIEFIVQTEEGASKTMYLDWVTVEVT